MTTKPLLCLLFLAAGLYAQAQRVVGTVLDGEGAPLEFATITLHHAADSSLVRGTLSGADGAFEMPDVAPGRYFTRVEQIGSGSGASPVFDHAGESTVLEPLVLRASTTALGEVTITARKPTIEIKADKTILNIEGTVNATGLNALELLRKAPGVTVDNNENISVKGKNGVRILIDGRETPLDGKDLAATLKGMQAADIANIEIISNPSAKYDAAGNAGIINIKLRKNKALGTNGNLGLEGIQGETPKGGSNFSLNHRTEAVNLYGSYNNHYGRWHNTQNFYRVQNGLVFDQHARSYFLSRWNSARIGADWNINSKHTLGVLLNGSRNNSEWVSTSMAAISRTETPGRVDSLLDARNNVGDLRGDLRANLNYRFADTAGRTLNVDFDHGLFEIDRRSLQPNFYRSANGNELLQERTYRSITPTDIQITTAKADYEQPLLKGTFSAGVKVSAVNTDNRFDFFHVEEDLEKLDSNISNRFDYRERTSAAYVNFQRQFGPVHLQAGLRMENTDYTGDLFAFTAQDGDRVSDNYTELFPSAAMTWKFNEKFGLNATYSRRIDRPSYQDLNPFELKLDELTYEKGNPRLRPQFTQSFELSPTYKGQPALTLGYSHTRDLFVQVLDTTNLRATFITQENIADQHNYSISVNIPTPIAKWWDGMISITGLHSAFSATFREGYTADQEFQMLSLNGEQNFRLPAGFGIQLSGYYNSRAFWGTLRTIPQGSLDLGIRKKVLHDKGELRLRFGDILRTAGWGGENVFTPGLKMTANGTWESRTVTLNFAYRFGSAEIKGARQRRTGLEEESRRVKSGN